MDLFGVVMSKGAAASRCRQGYHGTWDHRRPSCEGAGPENFGGGDAAVPLVLDGRDYFGRPSSVDRR
jgi:hypothetical protein